MPSIPQEFVHASSFVKGSANKVNESLYSIPGAHTPLDAGSLLVATKTLHIYDVPKNKCLYLTDCQHVEESYDKLKNVIHNVD